MLNTTATEPTASQTVPPQCRVCGSGQSASVTVALGQVPVTRCPSCDVLSFADVLDDAALAAAYDGFTPTKLSRQHWLEYVRQSRNCLAAELKMRPGAKNGESLRFLDYGCGSGHFV